MKDAPVRAFRSGFILEKAEKERALFGFRGVLGAVEVPKERLTGMAWLGLALGTPKRPERRIVALNALVVGEQRFEWGEDLQTFVAVEIPSLREVQTN